MQLFDGYILDHALPNLGVIYANMKVQSITLIAHHGACIRMIILPFAVGFCAAHYVPRIVTQFVENSASHNPPISSPLRERLAFSCRQQHLPGFQQESNVHEYVVSGHTG